MRRNGVFALLLVVACQTKNESPKHEPAKREPLRTSEQAPPPFDLKNPPADATRTASGLVYKKEVVNVAGDVPGRNDTVLIQYTGWKPSGETFFTTKLRGHPMPLDLSASAPGFVEGMQLLHKGEKAVLWVPPSIGYRGKPQGVPEMLVYEVEVVEIVRATPVPGDVAGPPASASTTKRGTKYEIVRAGTGKDRPRASDIVTFTYTGWDATGRMFETTEVKKRPAKAPPFHESASFEEILTSMTVGERRRFWIDSEKMQLGTRSAAAPQGQVCYEVELIDIAKGGTPAPVPPDVAAPPADAKKTARGTFYKVLHAGKGGPKPTPYDTATIQYTGWTTDGRMIDSTASHNQPTQLPLQGGMAGQTDGISQMSVGDKFRLWIPEPLAYKGAPGHPQGMLVYDIELLDYKPTASPDGPPKR